jgi:anaerobic selenocysteine-containing dehydrogenase
LADVVLPAALWGEKTGTFTNADRTVHLSEHAVEPPGEARADLETFIDFAQRLDLRDKDGAPLVKWSTPEEAYRAWQECSRGRPCDYSDITYERLRDGSGIQWGGERLYSDGVFLTEPELCEDYGHDIVVGNQLSEAEFRALNPNGRAILKAADWTEPHEWPDEEYPLVLNTGRTIYQFHTRTKTGRAQELEAAAPDVWVELAQTDAERLGIEEGDVCDVASPRGTVRAPARISGIREGVVFLPFHYGSSDGGDDPPRAANELTITQWDPVSKQPVFKTAKVRVTKVADGSGSSPAPDIAASAPAGASA